MPARFKAFVHAFVLAQPSGFPAYVNASPDASDLPAQYR
jgi:hypothetical protein